QQFRLIHLPSTGKLARELAVVELRVDAVLVSQSALEGAVIVTQDVVALAAALKQIGHALDILGAAAARQLFPQPDRPPKPPPRRESGTAQSPPLCRRPPSPTGCPAGSCRSRAA